MTVRSLMPLRAAALFFAAVALCLHGLAMAATPQMEAALEAAGRAPAPKAKAQKSASGQASRKASGAAKGASGRAAKSGTAEAQPATANVYAGQPAVTEKELLAFANLLPQFRAWARTAHEEAHPVMRDGKADFLYSPNAAEWVTAKGWQPARFFCVMGRLAAALVIVEEGNDMGSRPADMPTVTNEELDLTRRHIGTLLTAGGDAPPIRP